MSRIVRASEFSHSIKPILPIGLDINSPLWPNLIEYWAVGYGSLLYPGQSENLLGLNSSRSDTEKSFGIRTTGSTSGCELVLNSSHPVYSLTSRIGIFLEFYLNQSNAAAVIFGIPFGDGVSNVPTQSVEYYTSATSQSLLLGSASLNNTFTVNTPITVGYHKVFINADPSGAELWLDGIKIITGLFNKNIVWGYKKPLTMGNFSNTALLYGLPSTSLRCLIWSAAPPPELIFDLLMDANA